MSMSASASGSRATSVKVACQRAAAAWKVEAADRPARDDGGVNGSSTARPLLVVDGDSFAHRAYHAIPSGAFRRSDGKAGNALGGVGNMLVTLWQAEQPRAVVVAWDTLEVPTYRHEALAGYQAGREFEDDILEQLQLLPDLVRSLGFVAAKGGGFEADDFLAAAVVQEEERGGTALVATSDRDAFQLASERTTILQPVRGVSELARIGPAEVRERYGVEPRQVPDFIALRGDPSDKIPGARGIGAKKAADLLREHGSLDALLAAGRLSAEAEDLLLYRRIATLDASAPLPPLTDQSPTWAEASTFASQLGLDRLATRLADLAA
jgi:DNA polymerase-1